jgi:putative heme d1 biosynthesis radical SAM protein NirJ2
MIISWNTTRQCNQYCKHCYRAAEATRDPNELSTAEGKGLLEEIAKAGFKIMVLSGGEPLMREDIYELARHGTDQGLRVVLGTNGTLITPEVVSKLKAAGVARVGISLDDIDPAVHDEFRQMEGAWERSVEGMRYCREGGLPFQIHTTVTERNENIITDMTDLAVELGAAGHHIFFLVPAGRGVDMETESLKAKQYELLLGRILEKQRDVEIELKPTCAPQFMRIAKRKGIPMRYTKGCLAGTSYCVITPTGEVQPCPYLQLKVGNVKEQPFSEIWAQSPIFHELRTQDPTGRCGACDCKDICGGCRARAYYYSDGDYMAEEPWCLYRPSPAGSGASG